MLSNLAVTVYPPSLPPSLSDVPGSCVVRNASAAKPSRTNRPVPISREREFFMSVPIRTLLGTRRVSR